MKLSEALEYCIENEFYRYGRGSEYMCTALKRADLREFVPQVSAHVEGILSGSTTLSCALPDSMEALKEGKFTKSFQICKAHYIMWIAELKEQGL